jgi:DNA modification methylase
MMWVRILAGDCREILPRLGARSVQCCISSPPYWGLRDYGTAEWEGGSVWCEHVENYNLKRDCGSGSLGGKNGTVLTTRGTQPHTASSTKGYREVCGKCGARRIDSQLGLEATPEEYISNMVAVFREVWRVLRDDGTLWVNMGDSYATGGRGGHRLEDAGDRGGTDLLPRSKPPPGLKPKDLCMMPARLALALQADGWYLRSEIVWHKPNPMPESVTDRPTKAHEMIYLLAKQEHYFYDGEAIREPLSEVSLEQIEYFKKNGARSDFLNKPLDASRRDTDSFLAKCGRGARGEAMINSCGRNKRTVWTIPTQPYAEAHFATFPEDLIKPCVLAGSRVGDTILDPFAGSGTVGKVALELGRRAVLIELNPAYVELARARTFVTPGFL